MKRLLIIIAIVLFVIGFAKHFQKDLKAHNQLQDPVEQTVTTLSKTSKI